jgi:hypothetical protein
MLGFHQDADHPDLGPCHIQLNHEDTPRRSVWCDVSRCTSTRRPR